MNKTKILGIILTILNIVFSYILVYNKNKYIFLVCVFLLILTIIFDVFEWKKDKKYWLHNTILSLTFISTASLVGAIIKYLYF